MNRLSEMIMRHGPLIGDAVEHYKREAEHWRRRYEALHEALVKNAFVHTHPAVTLMAEPQSYEAGRIKGREEAAAAEREACARVCDTEFWNATKRDGSVAGVAAGNCAAAIRARGQA